MNLMRVGAKDRPAPKNALSVAEILDRLERHYGTQTPRWPTDPYRFIVWWHCGYPPSDAACIRGWESLTERVGIEPAQLLAAKPARLVAALTPGGMVPGLRAKRLKAIAARVQDEFGGDLTGALAGRLAEARSLSSSFQALPAREPTGFCCSEDWRPLPPCPPTVHTSSCASARGASARATP